MYKPTRKTGLLFVMTGAIFWGVGGTVTQKLFQEYAININWLVTTRLFIAGLLLLAVQFFLKNRSQIFDVWKNRRTVFQLLIFGLLGMLGVQYTFMASINYGNAAVATLLQYLAPIMIIFYLVLSRRQSKFTHQDIIAALLALGGCFFLLTNGSFSELSVPKTAVFWGILSGLTLAFYTLYAVQLLVQFDSLVVVGWAMIIGSLAFSFIHPPWQINLMNLPIEAFIYLIFVIVFGTMIAFWFYIESLHSLSPKETSLIGSLEPVSAVLTTVFWLNEPFGYFQWIGTACVIGMILFIAFTKKSSTNN